MAANITIQSGGSSGSNRTVVPTSIKPTVINQFKYWDDKNATRLKLSLYNCCSYAIYDTNEKTVIDTVNKKVFTTSDMSISHYLSDYSDQHQQGIYLYDHTADTCNFIEINKTDFATYLSGDTYIQHFYDSTSSRLFILRSNGELFEMNTTTGALTQKTTCTLTSLLIRSTNWGGFIYTMNTSKSFVRYEIATNTWTTLTSMPATPTISTTLSRIITDGTHLFVSSSGSWQKYTIATNTWTAMATTSQATYSYGCEVFNGKIYCIIQSNSSQCYSVTTYTIATNTWTSAALNLQTAGMTGGGAPNVFQANNKLYWSGFMHKTSMGTNPMSYHTIFEMNTSEVLTEVPNKYEPVPSGRWTSGIESEDEGVYWCIQKSCQGSIQSYSNFGVNEKSFRKIPYIDTVNATGEYINCPEIAGKAREWLGSSFIVKGGKLYAMDPHTYQLYVCTIGIWTWTELDNLYTRLGNKVPFTMSTSTSFALGSKKCQASRGNIMSITKSLFTTKSTNDIFLICPNGETSKEVFTYRYNIGSNTWEYLASNVLSLNFPYFIQTGLNGSSISIDIYSNENSDWIACYLRFVNITYINTFTDFDENTFKFSERVTASTTSYALAFTQDGLPIFSNGQATSSNSDYFRLYINDMDLMTRSETGITTGQYMGDENLNMNVQAASGTYNLKYMYFDKTDITKTKVWDMSSNGVNHAYYYDEMINNIKGGELMAMLTKDISAQTYYPYLSAKCVINNDSNISVLTMPTLPTNPSDAVGIFSVKMKKNAKIYLESNAISTIIGFTLYFGKN